MAFGIETVTDTGVNQLSSDLLHLRVIQEGTLAANSYPGTLVNFPAGSHYPLIVIRGGRGTYLPVSPTSAYIFAPNGLSYKALSNSYPAARNTGVGLQIFDESCNPIYDSEQEVFTVDAFVRLTLTPDGNIGASNYIHSGLATPPAGKQRWSSMEFFEPYRVGRSCQPLLLTVQTNSLVFSLLPSYLGPVGWVGETDSSGFPIRVTLLSGY